MMTAKIFSSLSAVVAIAVATAGCSAPENSKEPSPVETVTHTAKPEVVEVEVTPNSCKRYVELSERAFEHAATLTEAQGDALIYMLNKAELGAELNDSDILILADYMDSMTAASDGIKSIEEDILSAKSGCIGDSDNV